MARQGPTDETSSHGGLDRDVRAAATYERLRAIFQLAPIGIGVVDLEGHTVLSNDALCDMLGYSAEEFASVHFETFSHPDDLARNMELFEEMASGRSERFEIDKRFFHEDGSIIWGHLTVSLLREEDGAPSLAIGMLENVTEKRRLELQLAAAEETYRMLVEQVPAVVYVAGVEMGAPWAYVSPQIERSLGFAPAAWLADPGLWLRQMHADDRAEVTSSRARAATGTSGATMVHYRMRRADATEIWIRDEFAVEVDQAGEQVFRGVMVDVTREKQLEASLERQAFYDSLTGLPNRELFRDRVEHCFRRRERQAAALESAVVFVDLDDFKSVNDSLGHQTGDELLRSVGMRIEATIRAADTAGRVGGDEFAILVEDLEDAAEALAIAARIHEGLQRPHKLLRKTVHTSASIGVAYLGDADSPEAVLRNADLAMYRAKEEGKGRIATYEPGMHTVALRRLDLRSALEDALDRGQLTVDLQPIVELRSEQPIGAEALLRWSHPTFGSVPPGDFIPIAESTGSIMRIGEWVLRWACAWLSAQQRDGELPLSYISVNVSPVQLQESGLTAIVADCLASTKLPPAALVLEVTERAVMSPASWERLRELKRLGVRVAIDDFGTGYASLAYLNNLAVDLLKIDLSLIRNLGPEPATHAVPRAVIQLAASLGIVVVAEGIETTQQRDALIAMGCDAGQGYLFHRPVTPEVAERLLRESPLALPQPGRFSVAGAQPERTW